ncbi:CinA family protein [Pelagibius litoralis]|uniref:CinA family protein n=1 Tax=Pelagibius litoralis TaxID=374515 RepID=A0A967CA06_9PROT|nr:CinA family protein [Pelagibius litoralis]
MLDSATAVLAHCRAKGLRIATAESCTGGLIAASLTEIAGSSDVVDRGMVTYSNEAKQQMLAVPAAMIEAQGAVSAEVAEAMARGAVAQSQADIAVSATGIAGPGGATAGKPVGLVYLGIATRGGAARAERFVFPGDRGAVRLATLAEALRLLNEAAG